MKKEKTHWNAVFSQNTSVRADSEIAGAICFHVFNKNAALKIFYDAKGIQAL